MSTKPDTTFQADDDLNEVVRLAFPQGTALLRLENGIELLNHGVRQLVANPEIALQVLGPRGVGKLGRALLAVGQRHIAVAERTLELEQAGAESAQPKPHSSSYNTERDR